MRFLNLPEPEPPSRSRVITTIAILQRLLDELPPSPPTRRGRRKDIEPTRWQRDPVIAAIKTLHPPDGIPTKRITNEVMRKQLNKLPQFQDKPIRSKETVRLARIEIEASPNQK
jgi:hypothetical protein